MIQHIEYILKHNKLIQKLYVVLFSFVFRVIGCFIKQDPHQVFFQSLIGKNFGDSPKILFDKMLHDPHFKDYTFVWAFDDPDSFHVEGAKKVALNSLQYYIEALKSGVWIGNVSIERGLKFKPKNTVYLNTWHGVPIKVIGNSQKTRNDYDYSDVNFMCCSCEFERDVFIRDFLIHKDTIIQCGMPRNDALYHVDAKTVEDLRTEFNIPEGKKVILYAPTWRDSTDSGKSYQIAPPINAEYLKQKLGDEYILLFRMHHLTTQMLGVTFNDFVRNCSDVKEVNKLLMLADILVSDYSATIFDYSILEKPVISFAYDYDTYAELRGFYHDLEDIMPGSVFRTQEQVVEHILTMDYAVECEKAKNIKQHYMVTEGKATETCMQYLLAYAEKHPKQ